MMKMLFAVAEPTTRTRQFFRSGSVFDKFPAHSLCVGLFSSRFAIPLPTLQFSPDTKSHCKYFVFSFFPPPVCSLPFSGFNIKSILIIFRISGVK